MSQSKKTPRIIFTKTQSRYQYPDFLEVQLQSFKEFFQLGTTPEERKKEGLYQVFQDVFPIADTRNNYQLEFLDYFSVALKV